MGTETGQHFSRETEGLSDAVASRLVEVADGERIELRIVSVKKQVGDAIVRMLAYNGSIPGPTLRARQGSEIAVDVVNEGDLEATVHWHGLRLENRFDGTHETQAPIPVGGRFTYRVTFPDPGVYWYHPHIREDYGQEMGLYGNVRVEPSDPDYWPAVHREVLLTLDDVLIEEGQIAPFSRIETTYAAMGRFGNVLLVAGEPDLRLSAKSGEVVRFCLTDTANTRVFKVKLPGARMKLVGGDSGRVEREQFVEEVVVAPSERVVVDVLFERPGELALEHHTPDRVYRLAGITVGRELAEPSLSERFTQLRSAPELTAERARLAGLIEAEPDKTLAFVAEMDLDQPEGPVVYACPMHPDVVQDEAGRCPRCGMTLLAKAVPITYACPMHPDVVQDEPGRCARCGMKLLAVPASSTTYVCPMHPDVVSEEPGRCPQCGMKLLAATLGAHAGGEHTHHGPESQYHEHHHAGHERHRADHDHHDTGAHDEPVGEAHAHPAREHHAGPEHHGHDHVAAGGIEWEDDMVEVNKITTPANMRWKLVDRTTGQENAAIDWHFRVGDRVKIRLVNEMDSDHPMHHPFHIHGAGRFLILARNGEIEPNLVWKDTVLVRTGEVVDILLDVTNPGLWMAHCHIAEHHESGMMFSFNVSPGDGEPAAAQTR
jgi:FtsP/CotA-like multicopper oxidase with cupredoxin domain